MANKNGYLFRLNRLLVWPTLILFMVYVACGYGITNPKLVGELTGGLLSRALALYLHTLLAAPVLILLLIHILIGLKFTLTQWGVKEGALLNAFLILLGAFATALLILMQTLVS